MLNVTSRPALLVAWTGESVPTFAPVTGLKSIVWSPLAIVISWSLLALL